MLKLRYTAPHYNAHRLALRERAHAAQDVWDKWLCGRRARPAAEGGMNTTPTLHGSTDKQEEVGAITDRVCVETGGR